MTADIVNNEHEAVQGTKNKMECGGGVGWNICTKMTFPVYLICFNLSTYCHIEICT